MLSLGGWGFIISETETKNVDHLSRKFVCWCKFINNSVLFHLGFITDVGETCSSVFVARTHVKLYKGRYSNDSLCGVLSVCCLNKGQSNLANGDVALLKCRMQKKSCRYLLSYSPGGSTRCEVGCIWDPYFGEGEGVGSHRWYHSKERWWFPIGSRLWPLRYLQPFGRNAIERLWRSNLPSEYSGRKWRFSTLYENITQAANNMATITINHQ